MDSKIEKDEQIKKLNEKIENLETRLFIECNKLHDRINKLDEVCKLKPIAIPEMEVSELSPFELFKNGLTHDEEWLFGWYANISCWFMDNLHLQSETSNELAKRFIKKFFEIDYNGRVSDGPKEKKCCREGL